MTTETSEPERLAELWQQHVHNEFQAKDTPATLDTMVPDAYVNHTIEMEWMLPGVAPTDKRVECPLVAIVTFRDGKLANEHIYWDQASVLVQLGLLDAATLPLAGAETASKLIDPALPSNRLIERARAARR